MAELNIRRIKKAIPELNISNEQDRLFVSLPHSELVPEVEDQILKASLREVVLSVAERYAKCSEEELKRIVYLTSPMRQILKREKYKRENLFNAPVDFSSACS